MLSTYKKALLASTLLVASLAEGAVVSIDTFDTTGQFAIVGPGGGNPLAAGTGAAAPESIGGSRYIQVTRTSGSLFDFVSVSGGLFSLSTATSDEGTGLIIWDGNTDSTINNGTLLTDLTDSGTNFALYTSLRSDLIAPLTFRVYSATGSSYATFSSPGAGFGATPFSFATLPFSTFLIDTGTGADFTAVTAITLTLAGTGVPGLDVEIDFVQSGVPEPATFALFGTALLGLGLFRRKR